MDYSDLKARLGDQNMSREQFYAVADQLCTEALAAIEELEARLPRNEWQPIETSPKDGTEFLTYAKGNPEATYDRDRKPAFVISKWKKDCLWMNRPDNMPSHWMPLPQPPEQDQ